MQSWHRGARDNVMQVPLPGSLSRMMSASCISAIRFTTARPRPVPPVCGTGFGLVVESVWDPFLLIFRNACAGVLHGQERVVILLTCPDQDGFVFTAVPDDIADEVFREFFQKVPVSGEQGGVSFAGKRKMTGPGADREISAAFFGRGLRIYRCKFPGEFLVAGFLQSDDIMDQR